MIALKLRLGHEHLRDVLGMKEVVGSGSEHRRPMMTSAMVVNHRRMVVGREWRLAWPFVDVYSYYSIMHRGHRHPFVRRRWLSIDATIDGGRLGCERLLSVSAQNHKLIKGRCITLRIRNMLTIVPYYKTVSEL